MPLLPDQPYLGQLFITSSNYIQYDWGDFGLTDAKSDDFADNLASAGNGNTVLDINYLG